MEQDTQWVKTTYLELFQNGDFTPAAGFREIEVREVRSNAYLNLMLFAGVGLPWRWFSRFPWSPEDWENHFRLHHVKTFLAFLDKELVGYFELEFTGDKEAEISFLGLFPQYLGRGHGGKLLSHAVERAFEHGVDRVWLHTCSMDAKQALPNYLARGFRIFREVESCEVVPDHERLIEWMGNFMSRYTMTYWCENAGQAR